MKLFEIKSEYENLLQAAFDCAEESEGVIPDDLGNALESVEANYEEKIHNCLLYYKNQQAEADAINAEAKKLSARAKSASNRAEWMKKYLQSCCTEGVKCSFPDAAISWRESTATEILNENLIPQDYHKISVSYDKTAIKKAINSGVEVPGALIVKKQNIQIK